MDNLDSLKDLITEYANLFTILSLLIGLLVSIKIWRFIYCFLNKKETSKNLLGKEVLKAINKPFVITIILLFSQFAFNTLDKTLSPPNLKLIHKILSSGYLLLIAWFLFNLIGSIKKIWLKKLTKKIPLSSSVIDLIVKILQITVIVVIAIITMQNFGLNITGLLALGGAGSIILGLAAKDLISNIFGSLIVYLDRPFAVGDWIASPDKDIEGIVEHISWRVTEIRTFDRQLLYVPNSLFTTICIRNPSRMTNRRINEIIGLRYQDLSKIPSILSDIEECLKDHPGLDTSLNMLAKFNTYGSSSLDILITAFTTTINRVEFLEIKQNLLFKIADIVNKHGADFAFPTSTINIPEPIKLDRNFLS